MRRLTVLLISVLIITALSGCKGGGAEVSGGKKIVLKVLHKQDPTGYEVAMEEMIFESFQEANPDIKLSIERLFGDEFHARVNSFSTTEDMPDLVFMWPNYRSAHLIENELVEELDPYLEDIRDSYVETIFTEQHGGKTVYMLPITLTATNLLYVNRALFKRYNIPIPESFDELLALPGILKGKSNLPLITIGNKSSWVMNPCLFSTIIGRLGGPEWAWKVIEGDSSFKDRPFIDSLYAIKNLYDTGALGKSGSFDTEYRDVPALLAENKAFIMIDGDWRTNSLIDLMSDKEQEQIELMTLPVLDRELTEKGATTIVAGTGYGMKRGLSSEKALAAWKFISYYAGPEASEIRFKEMGVLPAYKINPSDYQMSPLVRKRYDFLHSHSSLPIIETIFPIEITNRLNEGLQELGRGEISPERLARELDSLLKEELK